MSEPSDKGFVVVDKRASAGASDEEPARPVETPRPEPGPQAAEPRVDFATLVQSFFVTALYHLGLAADPDTRQPVEPNLPAARQDIEILELLAEKTRGNLDTEESRMLESVLYELRMRFVEASRPRQPSGS
jgi:hypothetical protein